MADGLVARAVAAVRRAREFRRVRDAGRTPGARVVTALVCVAIGLMITVSSLSARGTDLRPGRNTDLIDLVRSRSRANADLSARAAALREEVDRLAAAQNAEPDLSERVGSAAALAGLTPVRGPAVTVTLSDAPSSVTAPGVDQDLLVVHQQDIQAIVNVMWGSGAEAMTIQGQRVTSTTGIKCVGNTVVLHGTPYAPPYVITAIGDPGRLERGLGRSEFVRVYKQYVDTYHLGYAQRTDGEVTLPGYLGPVRLEHARPLG
ncbi:DUF881 domain-containing protein [Mariniluteicoccus flavus]